MRPVALVTGARRGIGRAICVALASAGYDLLGCDVVNEGFGETAAGVRKAGGAFAHRLADLSELGAIAGLADWAWAQSGGVEALVNNAGVGAMRRGDPLEMTPESWDRCMAVNARAPFLVSQALARRMVAADAPRRGSRGIILITSANAALASPERTEYSASKAAAGMVARCLALRLAEDGIPVHEVRPGVIRTDMTAPVAARYDQRIADGLSPIRRWGEPEDVAKAVAGLLTGAIPFSTGDAFHVDGGLHLHRL
jgi:NAD(P)-dependent dehydrogenase (short-subunit alcohol dehydrogenase family)